MEEEIESCEACGAESAAWELGADPAAYIAQLTAERDRYKTALAEIAAKPTLDAAPLHSIAKKALPPNAVDEASGLKGLDALYTKEG